MDKEKANESVSFTLGVISVLAIIGLVVNNNYETNEVLSSIINFTQVAIPVLVLIGMKLFKERSYTFLDAGKNALIKLQSKYKNDIEGPRANSMKPEDIEEADRRNKYLFLKRKNEKLKTKVTFMPLNDLEDGVVDIRVSKSTLVNKNMEGTDDEILDLQDKVYEAIKELVSKQINKEYYDIYDREKKSKSAIVIDFQQENLGFKKYEKIVYACGEAAFKIISNYKK